MSKVFSHCIVNVALTVFCVSFLLEDSEKFLGDTKTHQLPSELKELRRNGFCLARCPLMSFSTQTHCCY